MTTKLTQDNVSSLPNFGIDWQAVKTSSFTAVAGEGYFVDTTSSAITVTLPASPSAGDTVVIKDYAGTFATNNVTIARNSSNIQGNANNSTLSTNRKQVVITYIDSTKGWLYVKESDVSDLQSAVFTSATGGTVGTSGDYKTHTFTGDGSFVVSTVGNASTVPTGGPAEVEYLVVAGGGGGAGYGGCNVSGSGGGAGGYRSNYPTSCGLAITATTYPISVGAGGSGSTAGSNSIFSTITSAGGGGGSMQNGQSGGSGAGAAAAGTVGSGNTPPVSPPQGNPGGTGTGTYGVTVTTSGGGGGIGGSGSPSPGSARASGGSGSPNSITGTATTYAAGGRGALHTTTCASNGGTNEGDGGDGMGGNGGNPSGAGGKGIVVIRYKFQ